MTRCKVVDLKCIWPILIYIASICIVIMSLFFLPFDLYRSPTLDFAGVLTENGSCSSFKSNFDHKIESSSAKMYFHYYGQLLHQQNMLQDYVRTGYYCWTRITILPRYRVRSFPSCMSWLGTFLVTSSCSFQTVLKFISFGYSDYCFHISFAYTVFPMIYLECSL